MKVTVRDTEKGVRNMKNGKSSDAGATPAKLIKNGTEIVTEWQISLTDAYQVLFVLYLHKKWKQRRCYMWLHRSTVYMEEIYKKIEQEYSMWESGVQYGFQKG